jgi:hypothetical protein
VVYRAAPHDAAPVVLHGGAEIPPAAFLKVAAGGAAIITPPPHPVYFV